MTTADLTSMAGRLGRSLRRLGRTHYPRYLFGMPLAQGETPVFVYHDVDPDEFRSDLEFLRRNGYRTLATTELVSGRGEDGRGRGVLLTFDDAARNFWDAVVPLLREFEARATLFAPTYWMEAPSGDPLAGDARGGAGDAAFLTWEELRACDRSGLVDVEAHGHRHALVYTAPRLVDFASPALLARHHLYDWPMRRAEGGDVLGHPPLGTPIYASAPLHSAAGRILENEDVARACVEHAAARGPEWFDHGGWRNELLRIHREGTGRGSAPAAIPDEAFEALLASEYRLMRERFERELGRPPRFLAYPWMLGTPHTVELAARSGIEAVFGVGIDFGRIRSERLALPAFGRTKGEWLRFLPGRGRSRLTSVLPRKLGGFFRDQHLAH